MFLPHKLPDEVTTLQSTIEESGEQAKVRNCQHNVCFCLCSIILSFVKLIITYKREKKTGDRDVVQFFNILFNRIFRLLKFSQHNRNFYDPAGAHSIQQYNLQVRGAS